MTLFDRVSQFMALNPWRDPDPLPGPIQTRAVPDASVAGLISRIQGARDIPYRLASTDEALGVPAILSAVTLISNGMGSMSLKAFQRGRELPDEERPRIIIRPNPFTIPRDFFRDTAYSMAVYGEAWWWVAARDFDGLPLSLIPVNPREIQVTEDPNDLRYPIIEWRGKKMPNADMKQITYLREPGALRGFGPLQKCGAAVSVAVEAQEWAANFYAEGGYPSIGVKMAWPLSGDKDLTDDEAESEADRLATAWMRKPHNMPRFYGPDIEKIEEFSANAEGAQMLGARSYNAVEAAQMFTMPAPMIEAAVAGGSLTYQNIPDLYDSFARRCLAPNYAEPIEQTMSDLLTRQVVARHNFEALLRVDLKTRWEVYEIASKVIGLEEAGDIARRKEGLAPGDVEFAPMPASVPAAIPASLPIQGRSAAEVRCQCGTLLAEMASPPYRLRCRKCKRMNEADVVLEARADAPPQSSVVVNMPERMVVVESPVTVNPPDIHVEPTFNAPEPAPMNLSVSIPQTEMRVAAMADKVASMAAGVEGVRNDFAERSVSVDQRLDALVAAQVALTAKLNEPRKPRKLIPERDEKGVIVAVTEEA